MAAILRVPGDYIQQAAHNASLAAYIRENKTDCLDWAVTCLFYAAVHYVNAYLTKNKIPIPKRHTASPPNKPGRINIVQQDPTLKGIYYDYRHLDDESRDARYELQKPSVKVYDDFLTTKLQKIKDYILPRVTT